MKLIKGPLVWIAGRALFLVQDVVIGVRINV